MTLYTHTGATNPSRHLVYVLSFVAQCDLTVTSSTFVLLLDCSPARSSLLPFSISSYKQLCTSDCTLPNPDRFVQAFGTFPTQGVELREQKRTHGGLAEILYCLDSRSVVPLAR